MMNIDLQDAKEVIPVAQQWINGLVVSGITERAAVLGTQQALIERMVLSGGPKTVATMLRAQAAMLDGPDGDSLFAELKARDNSH